MGRAGWRLPAVTMVVGILAACGGSGEEDTASTVGGTAASPTSPATTPTTTPTTPSTPTSSSSTTPTTAPVVDTTVAPAPFEVACSMVSLPAGAVSLPAERCEPADGNGPRPAVLVLNGCGGYEPDAGITTAITRRLAEVGVIALRLDYLAARPAPDFTYCDAVTTAAAAPDLLRALVAATASLRADPTVDPARIGAVGYSLGGLAVGFAQIGGGPFGPLDSPGFGAIGLLSAVIPGQIADQARVGKLPPVMIVHGADDQAISPRGPEALAAAATQGGVLHELQVIPGQGHEWVGDRARSAADDLATFLTRHLGEIQVGRRD